VQNFETACWDLANSLKTFGFGKENERSASLSIMTFADSVFLVIYFMNMKNRTADSEVKRGGVTREQEEENCSSHRERPLKVPAHVKRLTKEYIKQRRQYKMPKCLKNTG
jgi:hypothetical protein